MNDHDHEHDNEHDHQPAHAHGHDHEHGGLHSHDAGGLSAGKFLGVTLLNAFITAAEAVGGVMSGSLALLSDAAHNLGDTVSIALSYFAWKVSGKPKDARKTYGYKRAQVLAAFVNSTALAAISVFLLWEAFSRLRAPEPINSGLMMWVAAFGLAANFISMLLLEKDSHGNMNVRSSYLHLLGDTISSVGVVLGALAIKFWGVLWVDPLITALIAVYMLRESWKIISKSTDILMQSSADLDYTAIQRDIEALPEVENIHHVHTWLGDEKTIYFEAHVDMKDAPLSEVCGVSGRIEKLLKEKYGISHSTLQFETGRCADKNFFKK